MIRILFFVRKWLWVYLVRVLMLLAVLLPTYGPWLDFRFAGRMPQHDHIYIGEVNLNHHQVHYAHKHDRKKVQPPHDCLELPLPAVINLPDQDAALPGLVQLTCFNNVLTFQRTDTIGFRIVDARYTISATVVPPLDKPPRL